MADFHCTLERHVQAIRQRDLDTYVMTIHDDITLVLPTGRRLSGHDAVEDFHREFFASPTWTQDMTLVHTAVTGSTGVAMYTVDYHDVGDADEQIAKRFLVGFVFIECDGQWLLLHDQCTPLPDSDTS